VFGDQIRFLDPRFSVTLGNRFNASVRIDTNQVNVLAEPINVLQFVLVHTQFSDDRHGGVVWVNLFYLSTEVIDCVPNRRVIAFTLRFISYTPHQKRGMVFVLSHSSERSLKLLSDTHSVLITEAVPLMFQPNASAHHQAMLLCLIKDLT